MSDTDRVINPSSSEWPERLNELGPLIPPKQLFARGLPIEPEATHVAIVGTRRPTVTGVETAFSMAKAFAEAGFVVVSGLACGIDAAAHKGCLEAGGQTIAVLGCGLDIDYPKRNHKLREEIGSKGTLLTEYEAGDEPVPFHFPQRNRIVAGLAHAVVVVEGGAKSGSLITARHAIDAGREVFAVPGSPRNLMSRAPNELIRLSQAGLAAIPEHVFEVLAPNQVWTDPLEHGLERPAPKLEPDESAVLFALDDVPISPDRIGKVTGTPPGRVALVLARLEVRALVVRERIGYRITEAGDRARSAFLDSVREDA